MLKGFGTVVVRFGEGFPVTLNAPVTAIDDTGPAVCMESATMTAKAAIITVSTGVLTAESIRFTPGLPDATLSAIENMPMEPLARVPLLFDGYHCGLKPNEWLAYKVPEEMPAQACSFLTWPFNMDLMVGLVGGKFGWELSAAGGDAAVDFALGELRKIFDEKVDHSTLRKAISPIGPAIHGFADSMHRSGRNFMVRAPRWTDGSIWPTKPSRANTP